MNNKINGTAETIIVYLEEYDRPTKHLRENLDELLDIRKVLGEKIKYHQDELKRQKEMDDDKRQTEQDIYGVVDFVPKIDYNL